MNNRPRFYIASRSTGQYLTARLGGVCHWSPFPPSGEGEGWDSAAECAQAVAAMGNPDLRAKLAPPAEVDPEPYLQAASLDGQPLSYAMLGPDEHGEAVAYAFADIEGGKIVRYLCSDKHTAKGETFRLRVLALIGK